MSDFLVQAVLAARNSDGEDTGWMQLLIFIVLAVFYAIANIARARAGKPKQQGEEKPQSFPHRTALKPMKRPQQGPFKAARIPYREPKPKVPIPPVAAAAEFTGDLQAKMAEPIAEEVSGEPQLDIFSKPDEPTSVPAELLLDLKKPDELRKAILHYEILGKPLSLREP